MVAQEFVKAIKSDGSVVYIKVNTDPQETSSGLRIQTLSPATFEASGMQTFQKNSAITLTKIGDQVQPTGNVYPPKPAPLRLSRLSVAPSTMERFQMENQMPEQNLNARELSVQAVESSQAPSRVQLRGQFDGQNSCAITGQVPGHRRSVPDQALYRLPGQGLTSPSKGSVVSNRSPTPGDILTMRRSLDPQVTGYSLEGGKIPRLQLDGIVPIR